MISPIPAYMAILSANSSFVSLPPPLSSFRLNSKTGLYVAKLDVSFVPHPHYGQTQLRLREWYDSAGNKVQYRYCWEKSPNEADHITAWENEHPHGFLHDPHHHHHVPFNRKEVQDSPHVRNMQDALSIIIDYIRSGRTYP